MKIIYTASPYETYHREINKLPSVCGMRINTVTDIDEPIKDLLQRRLDDIGENKLWVDLKGRQLRITDKKRTPYHLVVTLNHSFSCKTPQYIEIDTGRSTGRLAQVMGNKAILLDFKSDDVREGQSLNVEGAKILGARYLSKLDKQYMAASNELGIHDFMLSYVEQEDDLIEVFEHDPNARAVIKVETLKGIEFVESVFPKYKSSTRLMAARGDLFNNLEDKTQITGFLRKIIKADPNAILASNIFKGLTKKKHPTNSDISDIELMLDMGYETFMIGDGVSLFQPKLELAIDYLTKIYSSFSNK